MTAHRILLGLALLAAGVFGWFFLAGLADGTVSSANIGAWLMILLPIAAAIGGGIALKRRGRRRSGAALLALIAVPAAGVVLFVLLLLLTVERWN
jgi:hypothetical protein